MEKQELKTLKDIENEMELKFSRGIYDDKDEEFENFMLEIVNAFEDKEKAEAVKWYHRSDGNKHKFIKEFFNLTEEEIKEGSSLK